MSIEVTDDFKLTEAATSKLIKNKIIAIEKSG